MNEKQPNKKSTNTSGYTQTKPRGKFKLEYWKNSVKAKALKRYLRKDKNIWLQMNILRRKTA